MLVLLARPSLHVAWEWFSAFAGDAEAQGFAAYWSSFAVFCSFVPRPLPALAGHTVLCNMRHEICSPGPCRALKGGFTIVFLFGALALSTMKPPLQALKWPGVEAS